MSTGQQKQTPYILESTSLSPVFILPGTLYPKVDCNHAPSGNYLVGGGYPLLYAQHSVPGRAPNIPSKTDSFDVSDNICFSNKTVRNKCISKVYFIIMCQLLVTTILLALTIFHQSVRKFTRENMLVFKLEIVITFGVLIIFARVENLRRKSPENVIFLFLFTVAESMTAVIGTLSYSPDKVLVGFFISTILCFAFSIFALLTKIDFTVKAGCLLIATIVVMLLFSVVIFFPSKLITFIFASVGAVIFSIYPIYDMQLMVEGKRKYSIAPEEYVFAVISIYLDMYLDIINMFMYILTILGSTRPKQLSYRGKHCEKIKLSFFV